MEDVLLALFRYLSIVRFRYLDLLDEFSGTDSSGSGQHSRSWLADLEIFPYFPKIQHKIGDSTPVFSG